MASEIPKQTDIEFAAKIFAKEFQKSGIGGRSANISKIDTANSGGAIASSGGESTDVLADRKLSKLRNKLLKENNKALQDYYDILQNTTSEEKLSTVQKKKLRKIEAKLLKDVDVLGDAFSETAKDFKKGKLKSSDIKKFIGDDISKLSKKVAEEIEEAGEEITDGITVVGRGIEAAAGFLDNTVSNFAIKAGATATVKNFVDQLGSTLKYGSSVVDTFGKSWDSFKLGISPSDLLELEAKNKRLVAGMGGAEKFADKLNVISDRNFKNYGDLGEAVKGSTQVLTAMSIGGINAGDAMLMLQKSSTGSKGLTQTFKEIQAATGQTFAEQAAAMEEYVKNDNIRNRLMGASNGAERRAVVERGLANKRMLVGLGLTAEQALRAGEALHGVAGMDPKERLKESYKTQAVMEAMGIENADLVAKGLRMGGLDKLAPKEQAKAMIAVAELEQQQAGARSGDAGDVGNLTTNALYGKLGSQIQSMANGLGDINLGDKETAEAQILRDIQGQNADQNSVFASLATSALEYGQMLTTGLATNGLLTGIGATLLYITKLMMMKAGKRGLLAGLGKMFSDKGKGLGGLIGRATDKVVGMGKIAAGGIGNIATNAGGLVGRGAGMASTAGGKVAGMASGAVKGASSVMNAGGKAAGMASGVGKAAGMASGAVKGAGMASGAVKGAGMASGAVKGAVTASSLGKMGLGVLSKGAGMLKFLGPIATLGSAVFGAVEGFNAAGEHFKGKELTAGMKAASTFGGAISSLTFGLVDAGTVAKGVHGMLGGDGGKDKDAQKFVSAKKGGRFFKPAPQETSMKDGKFYTGSGENKKQIKEDEFFKIRNSLGNRSHANYVSGAVSSSGKGENRMDFSETTKGLMADRQKIKVKKMSEDDFNGMMGDAGGDKKLRQFLIQARYGTRTTIKNKSKNPKSGVTASASTLSPASIGKGKGSTPSGYFAANEYEDDDPRFVKKRLQSISANYGNFSKGSGANTQSINKGEYLGLKDEWNVRDSAKQMSSDIFGMDRHDNMGDFSQTSDSAQRKGGGRRRNRKKIGKHRKNIKGMSEDDFNTAMGEAGSDSQLRQFLIQSRFAGQEESGKVSPMGGKSSTIQAPMGTGKSLNTSAVSGNKGANSLKKDKGSEPSTLEMLNENTVKQNELLQKIVDSNEKGVSVNEKQLKTSDEMKRNQDAAYMASDEYQSDLAFGNAEF